MYFLAAGKSSALMRSTETCRIINASEASNLAAAVDVGRQRLIFRKRAFSPDG